MDGERFDRIARQFARSTSRRRLIGGLLGGVLTGLGLSTTSAQGACSRDKPIRCGTDCADLRTNPEHCGRCNRQCAAGKVCYAGRCMTSCPNGYVVCGGTCYRPCTGGQVFDATCNCVCPDGQRLCQGRCIPADGCCTTSECPNDGLACTTVRCVNNICVTTPRDDRCDDGSDCNVGICDPSAGCVYTPSDALCEAEHFWDLYDECQAPVCMEGTCVAAPANVGEHCSDGDPCMEGKTCQADGSCGGGVPATCPDCQTCSGGACVADSSQNGTACIGSNRCLTSGTCQDGECAGGEAVVCDSPPDVCRQATGTCNPATGTCSYPAVVCNNPGVCEVQAGAHCFVPAGGCVYPEKSPLFQPCDASGVTNGRCFGNVCQECIAAGQLSVNGNCSHPLACCSGVCNPETGNCS